MRGRGDGGSLQRNDRAQSQLNEQAEWVKDDTEVSGGVITAVLTETGKSRSWEHFHGGDRESDFRQAEKSV